MKILGQDYVDVYGNKRDDLVWMALAGIVNSYPDAYAYDPELIPPFFVREALDIAKGCCGAEQYPTPVPDTGVTERIEIMYQEQMSA